MAEENSFRKNVCLGIKKLRIASQITQKEIADRLHITQTSYSQFEAGNRKIDIERLEELANIFGVPIGYFFRGKKKDKIKK